MRPKRSADAWKGKALDARPQGGFQTLEKNLSLKMGKDCQDQGKQVSTEKLPGQ